MADIAMIFHWSLSDLEALEIEELIRWRRLAIDRWNKVHAKEG
jgi:hypothetical protein